jgi:acetyl esterase/lipase
MKAIRMKQICRLFAGIVGAWALSPAVAAAAENGTPNHRVMNLWPDGSPNNPAGGPRPNLEIFYPFAAASVVPVTMVICPGGGYGGLSPYEREMAIYFRALGYTAVVVNYRVAPNRYPAPYADAARAIRLLRQHAGEWKIPAKKIALMGGSAGGHLAALVATRPNLYADPNDDLAATVSARPDRLILAYPVISAVLPQGTKSKTFLRLLGPDPAEKLRIAVSAELHVSADTPPTFLFHAADDDLVPVEHSLAFARACWAAGVPAELHIYPRGGHGRLFAYAAEVSPRWREALLQWLADWAR